MPPRVRRWMPAQMRRPRCMQPASRKTAPPKQWTMTTYRHSGAWLLRTRPPQALGVRRSRSPAPARPRRHSLRRHFPRRSRPRAQAMVLPILPRRCRRRRARSPPHLTQTMALSPGRLPRSPRSLRPWAPRRSPRRSPRRRRLTMAMPRLPTLTRAPRRRPRRESPPPMPPSPRSRPPRPRGVPGVLGMAGPARRGRMHGRGGHQLPPRSRWSRRRHPPSLGGPPCCRTAQAPRARPRPRPRRCRASPMRLGPPRRTQGAERHPHRPAWPRRMRPPRVSRLQTTPLIPRARPRSPSPPRPIHPARHQSQSLPRARTPRTRRLSPSPRRPPSPPARPRSPSHLRPPIRWGPCRIRSPRIPPTPPARCQSRSPPRPLAHPARRVSPCHQPHESRWSRPRSPRRPRPPPLATAACSRPRPMGARRRQTRRCRAQPRGLRRQRRCPPASRYARTRPRPRSRPPSPLETRPLPARAISQAAPSPPHKRLRGHPRSRL
mmetsp:Transcript_26183/g.87713  ORF Transcript_26183/g.87713 Transcript_26183/m.87713 type:complete len:492 (-) Transcript_26183:316-1791(-)